MNLSNLKRWWADQCAQSATGMALGKLVAAHKQMQEQNKALLAENRKLANAIRAIHDYEIGIATNKTHAERLAWSHTYAVTCAALGINKGRAEAANAPRADKCRVAHMATAGISAMQTGRNPLTIDRDRAYAADIVTGGKDMQATALESDKQRRETRRRKAHQAFVKYYTNQGAQQ